MPFSLHEREKKKEETRSTISLLNATSFATVLGKEGGRKETERGRWSTAFHFHLPSWLSSASSREGRGGEKRKKGISGRTRPFSSLTCPPERKEKISSLFQNDFSLSSGGEKKKKRAARQSLPHLPQPLPFSTGGEKKNSIIAIPGSVRRLRTGPRKKEKSL